MYLAASSVLALLATAASGKPTYQNTHLGQLVVREQVGPLSQWRTVGSAPPETHMNIHIGLKQGDIRGLERTLLDISDPKSTNYGKWLNKSQVESYTQASEVTVRLVRDWLSSSGIPSQAISQPLPDWLEVNAPLSQIQGLLNSNYKVFQHRDTNRTILRTTEYSVPESLHQHIDTIQPTTSFHSNTNSNENAQLLGTAPHSFPSGSKQARGTTLNCDYPYPQCIREYYNVDYTSTGKVTLGVTGFLNYSASHTDAAQYLGYFSNQTTTFEEVSIAGAVNDPTNPGAEGNFDTQISAALGYPSNATYYTVGPVSGNAIFSDELLNLGLYLNSVDKPPSTMTTSYSGEEQSFTDDYMTRICNEYLKAGARGVSLFFSSGDYGVAGRGETDCSAHGLYASFPSTCPWVTSVGGTMVSSGQEVAAVFPGDGHSGGGFSNFFSTPDYQKTAAQDYLASFNSSKLPKFNAAGRGYPDVALLSNSYYFVDGGNWYIFSGTSVATPTFAALISLINDYRLSNNKPVLGFLNPRLYTDGNVMAALKDIVSGSNPGCGTPGFSAAKGWDPLTGLGSMDFAKLRKALG